MTEKKTRVSKKTFALLEEGDRTNLLQDACLSAFGRKDLEKTLLKILGLNIYVFNETRDKGKKEYAHGKGKKDYGNDTFTSPFTEGVLYGAHLDKLPNYLRLAFWVTVRPNAPVGYYVKQLNGWKIKSSYNFVKRNLPELRKRYFELTEASRENKGKWIDPTTTTFLKSAVILLSSAASEKGVGKNTAVIPNLNLLSKVIREERANRKN